MIRHSSNGTSAFADTSNSLWQGSKAACAQALGELESAEEFWRRRDCSRIPRDRALRGLDLSFHYYHAFLTLHSWTRSAIGLPRGLQKFEAPVQ